MRDAERYLLHALRGQQLFGVKFVLDYIQLEFLAPTPDGLTLTVAVPPATDDAPLVKVGADVYRWEDAGYRDNLCACLGASVQDVVVTGDGELVLDFDNGAGIIVRLEPKAGQDSERVIFHDGVHLWTW